MNTIANMPYNMYLLLLATSVFTGVAFSILHSALSCTQRAGLSRLIERHPSRQSLLSTWEPNWDRLITSVLLLSFIGQSGFVILVFAKLSSLALFSEWATAGLLAILIILCVLIFHIVPLIVGESYADRISYIFLPSAVWIARLASPFAVPVAWLSARLHAILAAGTDETMRPSSEDTIRSLVEASNDKELEEEEKEMIRSVLDFDETVTREIMVPRVDIEGLEDILTIDQCIHAIKNSRHSRFPVFHEHLDDIRGIVHVKDILGLLSVQQNQQRVLNAAKPVPFVPESMPINDLLRLLRSEKSQLAIVVDEYGGTAGLVTVEDAIEELVGEIHDEYDLTELSMQQLSDGSFLAQAKTAVYEANEQLPVTIPESEEYDSLGGYIFSELGRIPRPGETLEGPEFTITVQTATARQILTLRIQTDPKRKNNPPKK